MLTSPNLFRGMVFGMAGRPPYANPLQMASLYRFWQSSGIASKNVEFLGYFSGGYGDEPGPVQWAPLVNTSSPVDVKATTYVIPSQKHLVLAVASWASDTTVVALALDHAAIKGKLPSWPADGKGVTVRKPAIDLIQNASVVDIAKLTVDTLGGVLLIAKAPAGRT
jgi:hypothetical protein